MLPDPAAAPRPRRPVWALPLAALTVGLVLVAVVGLAVTRAVAPTAPPVPPAPTAPSTTSPPPGGPLAATTRPPGTCVHTDTDTADPFEPVPVPRTVPCDQPHDVEVLAVLAPALADADRACAELAADLGVPATPGPVAHRTGTAPVAPRVGDRQSDAVVLECLLVTDLVTGSATTSGFGALEPAS